MTSISEASSLSEISGSRSGSDSDATMWIAGMSYNPMLFPCNSSVAPGISSSSSSSSSGSISSPNSLLEGGHRSGGVDGMSADTISSDSSVLPHTDDAIPWQGPKDNLEFLLFRYRLESLPVWDHILEPLHEDILQSRRPKCLLWKKRPSNNPNDTSDNIDNINSVQLQMNRIQRRLDRDPFNQHGHGSSKLHNRMAELAQQIGDVRVAVKSLRSVVAATVRADKSFESAMVLATAYSSLADICRDECHWKDAIGYYQAALAVLETHGGIDLLRIAEVHYKIGSTIMLAHDGNSKAALSSLDESRSLLAKLGGVDREHDCEMDHYLGKILVAIGDAYARGGETGKAMDNYQEGRCLLIREGKDFEAIFDAYVAISDLQCTMGATKDALESIQSVDSTHYTSFPELYEYTLLKRAILLFGEGKTESALEDISSYIQRHEQRPNAVADLPYFVAMLSVGACHQLEKRTAEANKAYKQSHDLVAQPDCPLLLQNPALETTLWNFKEELLNPVGDVVQGVSTSLVVGNPSATITLVDPQEDSALQLASSLLQVEEVPAHSS